MIIDIRNVIENTKTESCSTVLTDTLQYTTFQTLTAKTKKKLKDSELSENGSLPVNQAVSRVQLVVWLHVGLIDRQIDLVC